MGRNRVDNNERIVFDFQGGEASEGILKKIILHTAYRELINQALSWISTLIHTRYTYSLDWHEIKKSGS